MLDINEWRNGLFHVHYETTILKNNVTLIDKTKNKTDNKNETLP